jgi:hypothetical protein
MKIRPQVIHREEYNVQKFRDIFTKNPTAARIYTHHWRVYTEEILLFQEDENKFQIITEEKHYGVSITDKIYYRTKRVRKVFVNNGKFHYMGDGSKFPFPINYTTLHSFEEEIIYQRYPWLKFLKEYSLTMAFNTIFKYKLYNPKKALAHRYGVPFPACLHVHRALVLSQHTVVWKEMKKNMINTHKVNPEILKDMGMLIDTTKMAKQLNRKVNAAWSVQRLKNEHNEWSRIITELLYSEINRPLKIKPLFVRLNDYIGGLITDTKTLAMEGLKQKHCVGTYTYTIDSGVCAIYQYKGYTAEIRHYSNRVDGKPYLGQLNGYLNEKASDELREEVNEKINLFCEQNPHFLARENVMKEQEVWGTDDFRVNW